MDLKKIIRGKYESLFYSAVGEVVNQKTCELLGFKEGIPVLSNATTTEANRPPTNTSKNNVSTKQTLRVEVNSETGEKYINLNGKKLRMVTESQLPPHLKQNAKVIKATPKNNCNEKKQVKIKIIGRIPQVLYGHPGLLKKDICQTTDNSKPNVNKADNDDDVQLSHKTVVIKESNTTPVKIPSAAKAILGNSGVVGSTVNGLVKSSVHQTGVDHSQENNRSLKARPNLIVFGDGVLKSPNGVLKMNPLDLSKVPKPDSGKAEVVVVKKVDKSTQASPPETVEGGVQTEGEEEFLLNILNTDFLEYLSSNTPVQPPAKVMSPKVPEVVPVRAQPPHSERFRMFFHDLRCAMMPDENGNRPIHVGVLNNDANFVKRSCNILKALQTPVDILNHGELTALQLAILNDSDPQIVKMLLMHGASLDVVDSEGNNIIHLAIEYKRAKMLDIILRCADERKFNLNEFNSEGLTPLMICCCNELMQCADLLLKYDADVNVKDRKSGRTALFHAAETHSFEMVQLLLNYNADTKIKNFFGTSPHDAMYEVDEIPENIKGAILGKSCKRKNLEEPKVLKLRRVEENSKQLKTYARFKKIEGYELPANFATKTK